MIKKNGKLFPNKLKNFFKKETIEDENDKNERK